MTSTCQVNKKIQEGRAVIVFFRDVKHVEEFKESSYFSKITNKIPSCFIVENALGVDAAYRNQLLCIVLSSKDSNLCP